MYARSSFRPRTSETSARLSGLCGFAGIGVADAGGELAERSRRAGVAIGAEQHFTGAGVAFLGQCNVADAFVFRRANIVEVFDVLLGGELAEDLDVAVGHLVRGEDVVV